MANETPWYYPHGWDRERMLNADDDESETLTPEQLETFRQGLRLELGEAGMEDFQVESFKRWKKREKQKTAVAAGAADVRPPTRNPPPYLETMNLVTQRNGHKWSQWGFVVFRTASYANEARWQIMRRRWDRMIDAQFQEDDLALPGVRDAKQKLRFRWIEHPELEEAPPDIIAARFQAMDLPSGMVCNVCLCINQASMESILDSPMPSESSRRQRKKIPFIRAVTRSENQPAAPATGAEQTENYDDDDAQGKYFRGYFNVAVETLLSDLFVATADDMMDPDVLGSHVKDDDIWCSVFRDGIHRIDTGYFFRERGR